MGEVVNNLDNDGTTTRFAHRANTGMYWNLPVDPWEIEIGVTGGAHAQPIGTALPQGDPDAIRLEGGLAYHQTLDLRNGKLLLNGSIKHVADTADDRYLDEILQAGLPVPTLPGADGLRWQLGARYNF